MDKPPAVRIVTDSVADLPEEIARGLGIGVVPARITVGDKTYREGVDLSREEFYEHMRSPGPLPSTGAAGPGAYQAVYSRLSEENRQAGAPLEGIISLHPPPHLSGLYNAAYSGSQLLAGTPVRVVDSGQISMGMGMMAMAAAQAAQAGKTLDEVAALMQEMRPRVYVWAALESLEWAARSGRVNRLAAALGNMLSVRPTLKFHDGQLTLWDRPRTKRRQLEHMLETALALAPLENVTLLHTGAPEQVEYFLDGLAPVYPRQRIIVGQVGAILTSYVGLNIVGLIVVHK